MVIRCFLSRTPFHHALSKFPQIGWIPFQKFQSLSEPPNLPPRIPLDSPEKSHFRRQVSLSNLLQRFGFPPSHLHEFLRKNQFLSDFNRSDIEKSLGTLLSFQLSQKSIVSILVSCPRVLEVGFLKRWEVIFTGLEFSDVNPGIIQKLLEQSGRFKVNPEEFHRNIQVLKRVGLSNEAVIRVLEENDSWVMMRAADTDSWIQLFMGIGISSYEFDRICYLFPGILGFGIQGRLKRLFEEIEDLGFSRVEARKTIVHDPRVLCVDFGELSRCVDLLKNLKCRLPIKEKLLQQGPFRAGFEVKLRVDCLCRHGLIRREAFNVLQREPRAVIYELEDVEKKIDFLLHRMQFGIASIMEVPEYLGVNFEKQIVPRYKVIEYLRSIGALGLKVGLKELIRPTRHRFYNLFVKPYPECEKIFGGYPRAVEVKSRHPIGLWKLFKPQSYPESKEDLRNIKLFMEALA
ncbi:Mitochodrial transcription termination factor-related [Cinnamomum micranthum f. kanehirae]|uniref:Mitochodrial transcription termination factor-related n=1 Tax=Cinnamomum micranthum f. kanehirae TaxID=337451 RepID=A0A3S3M640_9MAGN|nr:Mitochodrial transcription termination factor-related [Cinnamomum micranthum f. kanehirae]